MIKSVIANLIVLILAVSAFAGDEIAIQQQIDALPGGGTVVLDAREYELDAPIILPSRVTLVGQGRGATVLNAADGVNTIETIDFEKLTGSNLWLAQEGVPYRFGVRDLTIRGGHHGVAFYGKGYSVRRVQIEDCQSDGFYSECANRSGQLDARDMPEAVIDELSIRACKGAGMRFRGPHNSALGNIISAFNHDWGFISELKRGVYDGGIEACANLHTYANGNDRGAMLEAVFAGNIIVDGDGLFISHPACRLGSVKALNAGGELPGVTIATSNTQIGSMHITMHRSSYRQVGLFITGRRNVIGQALLSGNKFNNDGADIDGARNRIGSLIIERFQSKEGDEVKPLALRLSGKLHDIRGDIIACDRDIEDRSKDSRVEIR